MEVDLHDNLSDVNKHPPDVLCVRGAGVVMVEGLHVVGVLVRIHL